MARPASGPLVFVAGDDETVILEVISTAAGVTPEVVVDLTGRTYVMSIATTGGATAVASAVGVVDGPAGTVTFTFAAAVTALLVQSSYTYDIVETASGAESTIVLDSLKVLLAVTA